MKNIVSIAILAGVSAASLVAADAANGKAVYDRSCKSCHGADGAANPAVAKAMKVEIPDLKSQDVQALSDAEIKNIIANGKGKMRPMKAVSGSEADDVAAYVHTLKK
jgi:mono/diheme cytochrome c family protein